MAQLTMTELPLNKGNAPLAHSNRDADAQTDRLIRRLGWAVFLIVAAYAVFAVPMNMDEAGIFHTLACLDHPFAGYNAFREACYAKNDLALLGGFTLMRPQFYTGLFHALLYAPFYFALHAPWGQYLFGLCFFMPFTWLLARLTRQPHFSRPLFLAFFPLTFQFIHDAGPVSFALLLFPLFALVTRRALRASLPARHASFLAMAALAVCATEEKAFFLYLIPSLALFVSAFLAEDDTWPTVSLRLEMLLPAAIPSGLLAAAGIFWLLLAVNQRGQFYISWLIDLARPQSGFLPWLEKLALFVFDWPAYAHNHFDFEDSPRSVWSIGILTFLFLAAFVAKTWRKGDGLRPKTLLPLAASATAMVVFAAIGNTWAGHHFVFLWPPMLVVFANRLAQQERRAKLAFAMAFFGLNLLAPLALSQSAIPTKAAQERQAIFAFFNDPSRASHSIFNIASWGAYFIQALYGPKNQLVTYTEPYEENPSEPMYRQDAQRLLALAAALDRTLYTACYGALCTPQALQEVFGPQTRILDAMPGLSAWRLYQITIAPP